MSNFYWLIISGIIGTVLGVFFFIGLWWTTQRLMTTKYPVLLLITSFIARFGVVLFGIYLISNNHWERMLACLFGFVMVKVIIQINMRKEGGNAIKS